jgi:hypothetical protein
MKKFVVLLALLAGCAESVPTGHIGMVRTKSGLVKEILAPGRHECWGFDIMQYLEVSDKTHRQKMNVLCADELNFGFTVEVLASVDKTKTKLINSVFENVTPIIQENGHRIITAKQLYNMYVKPVVDEESRKAVGKYATSGIVRNRVRVIKEAKYAILKGLKDGVMKIKRISVTNLDFPDIITKAQERKARKRVEIQTEKAEQEKRIIAAQNKIKIAQLDYKRRLIEAAMIADANKIIGSSLSKEYLAWWQLKVFSKAAMGKNNWGFIPYTDHTTSKDFSIKKLSIDAALRKRLEQVQKEAAIGKKKK